MKRLRVWMWSVLIITVMSHDQENDPDIVAMVATSAALTLSGAPFMGPIGAARVGFSNNEYVLNPTIDEMKDTQLDLVNLDLRTACNRKVTRGLRRPYWAAAVCFAPPS